MQLPTSVDRAVAGHIQAALHIVRKSYPVVRIGCIAVRIASIPAVLLHKGFAARTGLMGLEDDVDRLEVAARIVVVPVHTVIDPEACWVVADPVARSVAVDPAAYPADSAVALAVEEDAAAVSAEH